MAPIHAPTVLTFTTLLSASLGALLLLLYHRDRTQPALASWGISRLLGAAAMPLLAARGLLPDWLSIIFANAMLCLAYGLTWAGARQFEDRSVRPPVLLAGSAVWVIACQIPAFYTTMQARILLIAGILAAYNVGAAWEFYRGRLLAPLPSRSIIVALLICVAAIFGICGTAQLFAPVAQPAGALPVSVWFALMVSLAVGLMAGTAMLLVALTKEQAELRSTTILAAARDIATEASEQKSRFLARMSHELRTPLNGVLGLAQVLANDPEQGDRQRRQAATLEQAGRHLLGILNEILDLSRIEAGKLELAPRPVALPDFIRETAAIIHGAATSKAIAFSTITAPELPHYVLTDPMRLRQILLNLLTNAVKFTPNGGNVDLFVEHGAQNRLRFIVTDTAAGVPEAMRACLFQDYAQAQDNEFAGGTGLGLAISARLARAMDGDLIHADGFGGVGSRFILDLPLPATAPPRPTIPPVSLPPRGLRILVVDDIALNRMTARALLEHAGYIVEDAAGGEAALAAVARFPLPDVILMDQSMPGMDGYTAARHIRAMPGPAGRLPILAVTANALREDIEASLQAGMDGHVAKPIELKALLVAIAGALERSVLRRQGVETRADMATV